ncbi:MAG: DoxX family protein [Archangium sp.]|nr:DoxX family protein [Archangium sp.]
MQTWTGRVLSGFAVLFLLFDVTIKLSGHPSVAEASAQLGLPQWEAVPIALVLLVCVALYVVPRTSVIGAVLLTGYLGGAIQVHVRAESPLFSHTFFPLYVAVFIWGGLFLRDLRVRQMLAAKEAA